MQWWWSRQMISTSTFCFVLFDIWILFFFPHILECAFLTVCKTENHLLSTREAFSIYWVLCKCAILHSFLPLTSHFSFIHLFINQYMSSNLICKSSFPQTLNQNCKEHNHIKIHGFLSGYFTHEWDVEDPVERQSALICINMIHGWLKPKRLWLFQSC